MNEELQTGSSIIYSINYSIEGGAESFTSFYVPCGTQGGMLNSCTYYVINGKGMNKVFYGSLHDENRVYSGYGGVNMEGSSWVDNNYRTISIMGGTDATNSTLIDWLYANAVKQ